MGTTARSAIRTAAAKENKSLVTGTATGGSTTTIVDTVRRKETDDFFNFWQALKTGGAGSGEIADITDFVQSSSTLTHAQTLTAMANTDTYELYRPPFKITDYNNAIDAALDEAYAKGFARRGWDETLYTTRADFYTLPSTLEDLSEVAASPSNLLPDPDWFGGGSGWTLHADGAMSNSGDSAARALTHTISGANQYTTTDASVQPLGEYMFRIRALSDGTAVAVARYQFINAAGALIGSATNFGTHSSSTSGLITGTFTAPANAYEVRIGLGSSSASGTVHFWEFHLSRRRWTPLQRGTWGLDWEANTGRLIFRGESPSVSRRLRLRGRRVLETLSADTDTVSFDAPELRAFVYLVVAKLWEAQAAAQPDQDRGKAESQVGHWRARFADVAQGMFDNFALPHAVRTPTFG